MSFYKRNYELQKSVTDRFLNLFDLDRETAPALLLILGSLLIIGLVVLITNGNIIVGFAPLALLALILLTFYRTDYSLFALIGFVLLFDQFRIPGFEPLTLQLDYFKNLKEISYLPSFNAGVVNPVEIHFLFILFIWFIVLSIKKRFEFNRVAVWGAFIMFFGWLIYSFIYGLRTGGEFLNALWEIRALFYFALFFVIIPQVIQTERQLKILLWIFIAVISIKAFQGLARFARLGFSFQGLPTLTNHEDPIFINTLFILLFSFWIFKDRSQQKVVLSLLFLPLLAGFFVAQRRAAIAALIVSLVAFFVLLPGIKQWKFSKIAVPIAIFLVLYGAALWNSDSRWAKPIQMVKTGIERPDKSENPRDYYSNLYRDYENYNLAYTTRQNPVFGIGFGKKYEQPLALAEISFSLKDYIPHNQILWIIVKTGTIGFFCFWFFFNSVAFQGAYILHNLNSPYLKAICMMIVVAIINQMVVSFYDLQLTYYRNMVYLGTLMGLLPVLQKIEMQQIRKAEDKETKEV